MFEEISLFVNPDALLVWLTQLTVLFESKLVFEEAAVSFLEELLVFEFSLMF